MLQFCKWHSGFFYQRVPFPFSNKDIAEYVWERRQDGASYSTLSSFTEAVNFGVHVLGMQALGGQPLIDQFSRGILDQASLQRPGRKQARPLTVREVSFLETCILDTKLDPISHLLQSQVVRPPFTEGIRSRCEPSRWHSMRVHWIQHILTQDSGTGGKTWTSLATRSTYMGPRGTSMGSFLASSCERSRDRF